MKPNPDDVVLLVDETTIRDNHHFTIRDLIENMSSDNLERLSGKINRILCDRANAAQKVDQMSNPKPPKTICTK
jgi:hypothetical protein